MLKHGEAAPANDEVLERVLEPVAVWERPSIGMHGRETMVRGFEVPLHGALIPAHERLFTPRPMPEEFHCRR